MSLFNSGTESGLKIYRYRNSGDQLAIRTLLFWTICTRDHPTYFCVTTDNRDRVPPPPTEPEPHIISSLREAVSEHLRTIMAVTSSGSGALQLLNETYGDGDSDEHDEEDSVKDSVLSEAAQKEKLPMPGDIKSMFSDNSQSDTGNNNNADHGGRIRSFAHVRGNWASFVYLPFRSRSESLIAMVQIIQGALYELPHTPSVTINEEFHLSLTKTVVFHHHWIEPFIQSLKKVFSAQKSFDVIFTEFNVYQNEEKTRTFIGMNIFASEILYNLIRDCDACLGEYGLEKYYQNASFHISIASCVGDNENWMKNQLLPVINSSWSKILDGDSSLQTSNVHSIELKAGNKVFQFFLKNT